MSAPKFFPTPAHWRRWLEHHHARQDELWVGFYKKGTGLASITWPESVDQALCYGWIDGIRKRIDDARYMIRFTPRRTGSTWSAVNLGRIAELMNQGLVEPAGREAFEGRELDRSGLYSYEHHLLGHECQAGSDSGPPTRHSHPGFRCRPSDRAASPGLVERGTTITPLRR